jgi:hypothetical protein
VFRELAASHGPEAWSATNSLLVAAAANAKFSEISNQISLTFPQRGRNITVMIIMEGVGKGSKGNDGLPEISSPFLEAEYRKGGSLALLSSPGNCLRLTGSSNFPLRAKTMLETCHQSAAKSYVFVFFKSQETLMVSSRGSTWS